METAKETTVNGAKTAGGAVASAAKELKTPAIAAGVGLAAVAGGIALGRGTKSKKSLSVPLSGRSAKATSKKLSGAAKNVGAVAEQTGQVAERVRQLSAAISGEQSAARRSPVEVVLEGLTKRSGGPQREPDVQSGKGATRYTPSRRGALHLRTAIASSSPPGIGSHCG